MANPGWKFLREIPKDQRSCLNAGVTTLQEARFVTGGEDGMSYPTAATQPVLGLLRITTEAGEMGPVQTCGKGIAEVGAGGVTSGLKRLTVEANTGRVVEWSPSAGANASIVALSTGPGGVEGEKIEIEVVGPGAIGQGA